MYYYYINKNLIHLFFKKFKKMVIEMLLNSE